MKKSSSLCRPLALALTLAFTGGMLRAENTPAEAAPVQSTFVLPATTKDGRDPFYPESTRMVAVPVATAHTVEISTLKVRGIFGTSGNQLAILNNHTFSAGEEGDVISSSGRVHLRCVEIHDRYVVVEINGQLHKINLEDQ